MIGTRVGTAFTQYAKGVTPMGHEWLTRLSALELIGSVLALTNGLAALSARGASGGRELDAAGYAERARRATRALVAGWGAAER